MAVSLLGGFSPSLVRAQDCVSVVQESLHPVQRLILGPGGPGLQGISVPELLALHPAFLDFHNRHKNVYHLNRALVRNNTPRDQCQLATCWINAVLTALEWSSAAHFLHPVALSDLYLLKKYLEEEGMEVLKGNLAEQDVWRTTYIQRAWELAFRYGLVPEESFRAKISFKGNATVAARVAMAFRLFLRNLKENEKLNLQSKFKLLNAWLNDAIGEEIVPFQILGEEFKPMQLYDRVNFLEDYEVGEPDPEAASRQAIQSLSAGIPVLVAIRWIHEFLDKNLGVATLNGFSVEATDSKGLAAYTSDPQGSHALLLLDYELDTGGRLVKFLAQNSHGGGGFFYIYADYFKAFYDYLILPKVTK